MSRLEKRHNFDIALSRILKYFDDVELVFSLDQFPVYSHTQIVFATVANMEPGFDLVFNVNFSVFKVEKWLKVSVKTKMEAEHKVANKHFKLK